MRTEWTPEQVAVRGDEGRRTFAGVEVHFCGPGRGVCWCSAWEQIDELVDRGYLRRVNYGPATYGHVGYFIVEEPYTVDMAEADLQAARDGYNPKR